MRVCEPDLSLDNVWHVLDVLEGSPAESAGLVPYGDWIVGWSGGVLSAESDFYDLVEAHEDKPLRVYVYSYDFDALREVVLVPNRQWGGEGLLGCIFGFGLLHRIPPVHENDARAARQNFDNAQLFVPADEEAYKEDGEMHDLQISEPSNKTPTIGAHPELLAASHSAHYLDPPFSSGERIASPVS